MPGKSKALQKAQKEVKRLEKLKQEILAKMPKKSNFFTKKLIKLLEKQLGKIEAKLEDAKDAVEEATNASDLVNKDVLEDIAEGKTDEVVEKVKDVAEDKIGDVIDDKIKDEGIKDTLKDVAGDVLDGDFDEALDKVKDGAEDFVEDKLEDLADDLLSKLEDKLIEKLSEVLEDEVGGLTSDAIDKVSKELGKVLPGQLVTNITKRIAKETPKIVKEEVVAFVKAGGLREILKIAKDEALELLKGGLKGKKVGEIIKEVLKNIVQNPLFKKIVDDLKAKLLAKLIQIIEEEVEKALGSLIDEYLEKYGNWKGDLLDTGKQDANIGPFWGCVYIVLSFQAELAAELTSKRQGLEATAKGGLNATVYAGVGIEIGFDIPVVGDVSIEGGIQGGPELDGKASISLGVKSAVLKASMVPATLNIDMSARLYLETPIPNRILSHVPDYVSKITVSGQNLYYPLGRINVLIVTTPSYAFTFDVIKGEYNYTGAVGKYNIDINPKVLQFIKEVKEGIEYAAQKVMDKLNPTKWDLDPFDDDGWLGGIF